jgi:hypothetical protein
VYPPAVNLEIFGDIENLKIVRVFTHL